VNYLENGGIELIKDMKVVLTQSLLRETVQAQNYDEGFETYVGERSKDRQYTDNASKEDRTAAGHNLRDTHIKPIFYFHQLAEVFKLGCWWQRWDSDWNAFPGVRFTACYPASIHLPDHHFIHVTLEALV
jgi:hypothetical protein